jgi:hypothetical protein
VFIIGLNSVWVGSQMRQKLNLLALGNEKGMRKIIQGERGIDSFFLRAISAVVIDGDRYESQGSQRHYVDGDLDMLVSASEVFAPAGRGLREQT